MACRDRRQGGANGDQPNTLIALIRALSGSFHQMLHDVQIHVSCVHEWWAESVQRTINIQERFVMVVWTFLILP